MKKNFVHVIILLTILTTLCVLTGCKSDNEENLLNDKIESELLYLDSKILSMANTLNNISFQNNKITTKSVELEKQSSSTTEGDEDSGGESSSSGKGGTSDSGTSASKGQGTGGEENSINIYEIDKNLILNSRNKEIDWDLLKGEIENLYSTWGTISLDLKQSNVNEEDIQSFSKELDTTTKSIQENNKATTLSSLTNLYSLVTNYKSNVLTDENKKNIMLTKECVLKAYSAVEIDNWDEVKNQTEQAKEHFSKVIDNKENSNINSFNIDKTNALLEEMSSSLELKDKDIFYIKYRNLMQELDVF